MTKTELNELLVNTDKKFDYSQHDLLVHLTCVYENDEEDFEVTFAVPVHWLIDYVKREWNEDWDFEKIQKWLQKEYVSEESEGILDSAVAENKIAFWIIN